MLFSVLRIFRRVLIILPLKRFFEIERGRENISSFKLVWIHRAALALLGGLIIASIGLLVMLLLDSLPPA